MSKTGLSLFLGSFQAPDILQGLGDLGPRARVFWVFPSKAQAEDLTSRLAGELSIGVSAVSFRSLVSELSGRSTDELHGRAIRILGISHVLRELPEDNELNRHPFHATLGQLSDLFRELEEAGVDSDEFEARIRRIPSGVGNGDRLSSVGRVYRSYRELLERRNWLTGELDGSTLPPRIPAMRRPIENTRFAFNGFLQLNRSQEMLIGQLSRICEVAVSLVGADPASVEESKPGGGTNRALVTRLVRDFDAKLAHSKEPPPVGSGPGEVLVADNLYSECLQVIRRVTMLIRSGIDHTQIAVAARDPSVYHRALALACKRYGIPLRSRARVPLRWFPLVREFIARMDSDITGESGSLDRLLEDTREPGLISRFASSLSPMSLEGSHDQLATIFEDACTDSRMIKALLNSLPCSAAELSTLIELRDLLRSFSAATSELDMNQTAESRWAVARMLIMAARVSVDADSDGVVFCSPDELPTRRIKHLFMLGFCEDMFPKPHSPGVILKSSQRERFNAGEALIGSETRSLEYEYGVLDLLRWKAEEDLHISLPAKDPNGHPLLPSRFLEELGYREHLSEDSDFFENAHTFMPVVSGICSRRDGTLLANLEYGNVRATAVRPSPRRLSEGASEARVDLPLFRARPRPAKLRDERSLEFLRQRKRYSVGEVAGYARCPLLHFHQHTLRLAPRVVPAPLKEGSILHEALANLMKDYDKIPAMPAGELFARSEAELSGAQNRDHRDYRLSSAETVRMVPLLMRFAVAESRKLIENKRKPVWFEVSLPAKYREPRQENAKSLSLTEDGDEILISGRIDRVDEFVGRSTYAIVDYKLSGLPSVDLDGGKAIQVLLYTSGLELSRRINVGLAEYVSITRLQRRLALTSEDKREKTDHALAIAHDAISSIRSGLLAFSDEDCSEQCQFRFLCKRDWTYELLGQEQLDAGCTGIDVVIA